MSTRSSVYYDNTIHIYLQHIDDTFWIETEIIYLNGQYQYSNVRCPDALVRVLGLKYEKGRISSNFTEEEKDSWRQAD